MFLLLEKKTHTNPSLVRSQEKKKTIKNPNQNWSTNMSLKYLKEPEILA